MHFDLNDEQRALRDGLRAYFAEKLSPEVRAALGPRAGEHMGPPFRDFVKQMGHDGWLGVGWPVEFGGQGRGYVEELIFLDECRRAQAPIPLVTLNTVGPTLMQFGSPEQKERFLPAIVRGEVHFAIGYTEPGSGTDLASLRTRAIRDGDSYVINGQKIFTTGAHDADYIWLAARTDPDAPKHKGITIFIVPTSSPGFSFTPIELIDGGTTNATYYEDVRVPASAIVGGENNGWRLIPTQLNHERVALACSGRLEGLLEEVVVWSKATALGGGRVIDEPWVRMVLARVRARTDALRLMNLRMAWAMTEGRLNPAEASVVKVFGTELFVDAYRSLLEVIGRAGSLNPGSPGAVLRGEVDEAFRSSLVLTFGGGVNEIQREIIAVAGLGMPRGVR
ncbi:MAG: acyl-CoA dehydrogenase family protein [Actinomycetota bacterium]